MFFVLSGNINIPCKWVDTTPKQPILSRVSIMLPAIQVPFAVSVPRQISSIRTRLLLVVAEIMDRISDISTWHVKSNVNKLRVAYDDYDDMSIWLNDTRFKNQHTHTHIYIYLYISRKFSHSGLPSGTFLEKKWEFSSFRLPPLHLIKIKTLHLCQCIN